MAVNSSALVTRAPDSGQPVPLPANTRRRPNVGLTLDRRRRRRANINPTSGQRIVFARESSLLHLERK